MRRCGALRVAALADPVAGAGAGRPASHEARLGVRLTVVDVGASWSVLGSAQVRRAGGRGSAGPELVGGRGRVRPQGCAELGPLSALGAVGLLGLHPHELRHTAASPAIASGADVKGGPADGRSRLGDMTLDTCGHLFDDRLDEVSSALDRARRTVEPPVRWATARGFGTVAARPPQPPATRPAVAQTLPNAGAGDRALHQAARGTPGQRSIGAPGRIRTFAPASGEGAKGDTDDDEQ